MERATLKPFRSLIQKPQRRLTTIIAIRCKDGVILCADSQATGETKEISVKIEPIGNDSLIACSGTTNYIELFKDFVRDAVVAKGSKTYRKALNEAIDSYSQNVREAYENFVPPFKERIGIDDLYPDAVFITKDADRIRVFKIQTPLPCIEEYYPHRATAGSGGRAADIFLKSGEYLLAKLGLDWDKLSTNLVAQMCWILVRRISYVDAYSSGLSLYRLSSTDGIENLTEQGKVFPNQGSRYQLSILIETAVKEMLTIPDAAEKLQKLVKAYSEPALANLIILLNAEGIVDSVLGAIEKGSNGETMTSQ